MGKALVLKGVNFSANKLDTVTIGDVVPCTGITLSQDTLTFTTLEPEQLTAILTPINTTDDLEWSVDDETVVKFANGIVTPVGIGTAVITAICGEQTATCSVTIESISITEDDLVYIMHRENSGTNLSTTPPKDYASVYGSETGTYLQKLVYFSPDVTPDGYKALTGDNEAYTGKYPIMIPKNAENILIEAPNGISLSSVQITYLDSTTQPTYSVANKGARAVTDITPNSTVKNNTSTNAIPQNVSGLDSFYCTCRFSTEIEGSPDGLMITFT